ncbi:MAG: acyl-CoA thioesterase [Actinomycetota bacterium]|nr:acyl-CoA thioesterase [Actinomycetota bacterium]
MSDRYGHVAPFPTRWSDNDVYGHLNNTIYYAAMDTTINVWLIRSAGFDPETAEAIAVCVSSGCEFVASASFPEQLEIGLRTGRVGTTSVTWELGVMRAGSTEPLATGTFVHVFVDRATRRPVPIPAAIRAAIERELAA